MNPSSTDLRRRLQRAAADGDRVRYPESLRREVVSFARRSIAEGGSQSRTALDLRLPQPTLSRWMLDPRLAPIRTVEVSADPGPELQGLVGLRLRTPQGYVVEGLDLASAAALLRALA